MKFEFCVVGFVANAIRHEFSYFRHLAIAASHNEFLGRPMPKGYH